MFSEISKISVFKGLKTSEIIQLLNTTHYQVRTYERDTIIAYTGDKCECFYLLLEGKIKGEMSNYYSKNIVVSEIHAPDTFAEAFLFADNNKLLINIIAASHVKVMIIKKNEFLKLLNKNSKILSNYLNATSNRFVIVSEKLKFLMFKTVKGKLANFILDLERENKNKISFKLGKTHEELAALFGITRPALTRNILKLKNEGLIEIKNKEIKILDREKLIQFLD